ncbi:hypothetical protein [Amycolatopsis alkalitolerans]|uniref:Uncharacterized protein n=1 Tax=Amycolatopsis alkalitolerans TaxID=2547244 RepID=A0A5C4LTE1_9PSEU|nr:hypothetical protein [Amycolatopsis alkalitolerans]TNC21077.1 hypothetical protein FG385_29260 [Amycolatopsis alkalitolerans]
MESGTDPSGITKLVGGNPDDARELRANLSLFARRADTPNVRRLVSDVLAGRRNVREVFRTPEFEQLVASRVANIEAGLDQLNDEERAEVWNQDRPRTSPEALESLRAPYDPPAEPADTKKATVWDEQDFSQNSYLR